MRRLTAHTGRLKKCLEQQHHRYRHVQLYPDTSTPRLTTVPRLTKSAIWPTSMKKINKSSVSAVSYSTSTSSPDTIIFTSVSHSFSLRQFDMYRLFAMMASCASANELELLQHLSSFIPIGEEEKGAEAILPVQVFSGIPKTIEGMQIIRATIDKRKESQSDHQTEEERRNRLKQHIDKTRNESLSIVNQVLGGKEKEEDSADIINRWISYDSQEVESAHSLYQRSSSLSDHYPSLPSAIPSSPSICSHCHDMNSTSHREHRGHLALNTVYSSATHKLLASLYHLHPSLHHSVLQHIYGAVLCTPILSIQCIELISISCLMYERNPRQLFSHLRGALMNGCTRDMCQIVLRDSEKIYKLSERQDDPTKPLIWVEDAIRMLNKIDRKVNPALYTQTETTTTTGTSAAALSSASKL